MSNVKGTDIDDLFKRASDKYPLRTDSANWDRVAADLDKDRSLIIPPPNMEGGDRRRRRRFLWLLLLLPLGGVGYYALWSHRQAPATASQPGVQSQTTASRPGAQIPADGQTAGGAKTNTQTLTDGQTTKTNSNNTQTPIGAAQAPSSTRGSGPAGNTVSTDNTVSTTTAGTTPGVSTPAGTAGTATRKQGPAASPASAGSVPATTTGETATSSNSTGRNRQRKTHAGEPGYTTYPPLALSSGSGRLIGDEPTGSQPARGQTTGGPTGTTAGEYNLSLSALKSSRARTTGGVALDVTVNANGSPVAAKDSSGSKNNAKRKDNTKDKKQSFLYAGLIVAPDLSMVKFQSVKGVGTTFGVLLGYQFNRRWAVETGAYLDRKKYYTDAEYFSKKNIPIAYRSNLSDVDGVCNMVEIPVNIRYNLSSGGKTKWFATAGLSTYLMSKESYVYKYVYNGNGWDVPWTYKKPSQYWFSVINLSAGFEQKLGKIGSLRLEPYVRIPLSGVGTGSLPIMSAGLNIGITRRIWK